MILLLCGAHEVDLHVLQERAGCRELELEVHCWTGAAPPALDISRVERCFLISPAPGVVALGERTGILRGWLGEGVPLVVCAPRLAGSDREVLERCGANQVVTPADWRPVAIAERVLADLLFDGLVQPAALGSLVGATPAMRELYRKIQVVAPLDDPVLVLGETGTGKELVTGEIHRLSGRPGEPLSINCAALTPELLESELFGHEKGAFSSAVSSRRGLLAEAGDGTVLLDEIGDLAPTSQAKLLRVLEERKVRPVGANRWQPIQARIILATNRDLASACQQGQFREDLFFRISGLTLNLPPLRERKADLLLLSHHFLATYNASHPGARTAPSGCFEPLFRHDWPGNVRELQKAVWQAATFSAGDQGELSALALQEWARRSERSAVPPRPGAFNGKAGTWKEVQEQARASYFRGVLEAAGGNKEEAARLAGVSRSQLYAILKQIGAAPDDES